MQEEKKFDSTIFFCFSLKDNENAKKGHFSIENPHLDCIERKIKDLTVLQVYLKDNNSWNIFKKYSFKIFYKAEDNETIVESYKEFNVKRNKIKFYYNASKYLINNEKIIFKDLDCVSQFSTFSKLNYYIKELISNTLDFFQKFFDLGLFLKLLEKKTFEQNDFIKIIKNFPNLKNNDLRIHIFFLINLDYLKEYKNKFLVIYSVITDITDDLNDSIKEEDLRILFDYNEKQKNDKIPIRKNFFSYFIEKLPLNYIKKLC